VSKPKVFHKVPRSQTIPVGSLPILLKKPLPHLMLILRGSTTTLTQQPASFTRNGKNQDIPLEVLVLNGDRSFTLQHRFLLLRVLRWEVSAAPFLCTILNRALLLHLLLWSLCSNMARRPGPSRGQILALGEGLDEVEGPGSEEEAFNHDMRGTKQEDEEEGAQSPQGIVLSFSTRSPWWKIHGGTCCHEYDVATSPSWLALFCSFLLLAKSEILYMTLNRTP